MRAPSLHGRLLVATVLGAGALALAGGLVVHAFVVHELDREASVAVHARCTAIAAMLRWENGRIEGEFDPTTLPEFYGPSPKAWFTCATAAGEVVAASPGATGHGSGPMRSETMSLRPLADDDEREAAPMLLVTVAMDDSAHRRASVILAGVLAATGAAMVAVLPLIASLTIRRLLAPLNAVAEFADQFGPGDPSRRIATRAMPAELVPIGERLNALGDRLIAAFERERRFAANAAHELRTPAAEIQALSELAVRWPSAITDAPGHHRLVHDAAVRQSRIIETLIALHRHENGMVKVAKNRFDLHAALAEAIEGAGEAIKRRSITVALASGTVMVLSDAAALSIVLRNLFENAVAYSPIGSVVEAAVDPVSRSLIVFNPAPQLDPADALHLGERFWRKDTAHSHDGHCGLGLALSRAIAQALDLELSIRIDSGSIRAEVSGFAPAASETPTADPR